MNLASIIIRIWDTHEPGVLIEEFTQKGSPKLIYNGADDKYQSLMASEFKFNMLVTDMSDGKFYHLYTGNEKRYKVTVHSDLEVLLWEGYLLPDFYSEPYENGSFFVELTATDGLGLLKGVYLDDLYYKKETSVMRLICEALKFCKLNKRIYFSPAVVSAATDYYWHEISVDGSSYLDAEVKQATLFDSGMPARKSAYDILDLLVKNLGCTLYCWGDKWFLEGINRKGEANQLCLVYDLDCNFFGYEYSQKSKSSVTFFATPVVSIASPWKYVDVSIDLDEEGDLLADGEYYLKEVDPIYLDADYPVFVSPNLDSEEPLVHWQTNGIAAKFLGVQKGDYMYPPDFNLWFAQGIVPTGVPPLALGVAVRSGNYSEVPAGNAVNFLNLKKPKYLKGSDARLARSLSFSINLNTFFGTLGWGSWDDSYYKDGVEDGVFKWVYRAAVYVGNFLIRSSEPSVPRSQRLLFDVDYAGNTWAEEKDEFTDELTGYVSRPSKMSASAEFDEVIVMQNGYAQIKLMGVVPPIVTDAYLWNYVVSSLKFEYTAEKNWEDTFSRDIDYTTRYKLELFHGCTVSDLTKKNFRFRRFIPAPDVPEYYEFITRGVDGSGFPFNLEWFFFVIDYDQWVNLSGVPLSDIRVIISGQTYTLAQIYPGYDLSVMFSLSSYAGVYRVTFIKTSASVFSNINNWEGVFSSAVIPVISGYVTEDNEWREKWRRYGVDESIRYGYAMAKMYHDAQPEPLVRIEGSLKGIYNPRELLKFDWRGVKEFVSTRLELDFSEGKTKVFMFESKHEIVESVGKYWEFNGLG